MVRGPPLVHWFASKVGSLVIPVCDALKGRFLKDGKDSVRNIRIKTSVLTHTHHQNV